MKETNGCLRFVGKEEKIAITINRVREGDSGDRCGDGDGSR